MSIKCHLLFVEQTVHKKFLFPHQIAAEQAEQIVWRKKKS